MISTLCIYHKDCVDGTTAAAVALRAFPQATFVPLSHSYTQEDIAPYLTELTEASVVYTLDCALGIRECLDQGAQVVTIDHHIGVEKEMRTLGETEDRFTFIFDTNKSGASLSWSYFFPNEPLPDLIRYVEDNDLWRHAYGEETLQVTTYLSMFRNNPEGVLTIMNGSLHDVLARGAVLIQYVNNQVESYLRTKPVTLLIDGELIPAYNITEHQSACGNSIATRQGTVAFLFTVHGDMVRCSFRSCEGHAPTALSLAERFGGGGHIHAAGATIPLAHFLDMMRR